MRLDTIGQNIRKYRLAKKMRQEDLAEKADLTANYIGMIERGEKLEKLSSDDRKKIYDIVDVFIRHTKHIQP